MKDLSPSDLKTILHSKRANLYYLEYCRVLVKGALVLPQAVFIDRLKTMTENVGRN
ncbi:MAG: hypothetical protein ABJH06_01605 [Paraglaciecola sp.]|uniref:hypothetical protein n=1 Tax=Paraglaciecola sp. TaxID=1920173 RepID=UPI0032972334